MTHFKHREKNQSPLEFVTSYFINHCKLKTQNALKRQLHNFPVTYVYCRQPVPPVSPGVWHPHWVEWVPGHQWPKSSSSVDGWLMEPRRGWKVWLSPGSDADRLKSLTGYTLF